MPSDYLSFSCSSFFRPALHTSRSKAAHVFRECSVFAGRRRKRAVLWADFCTRTPAKSRNGRSEGVEFLFGEIEQTELKETTAGLGEAARQVSNLEKFPNEVVNKAYAVCSHIEKLLKEYREDQRIMLGIAGVPGCGKSTLTKAIMDLLRRLGISCGCIAMDGFHIPLAKLAVSEHRRRGAPHTFNARAFASSLRKVREAWGAGEMVYLPTFDHDVGDPVAKGNCIGKDARVVLVEGNYLCLRDDEDWKDVYEELMGKNAGVVYVEEDSQAAMDRVLKRLIEDLKLGEEEAVKRVNDNDRRNAMLVVEHRRFASHVLEDRGVEGMKVWEI